MAATLSLAWSAWSLLEKNNLTQELCTTSHICNKPQKGSCVSAERQEGFTYRHSTQNEKTSPLFSTISCTPLSK